MKNHLYKNLFILGFIVPTFLFSACSDKSEHIHISYKSKVWLGVEVKNISERRLDNLKLDSGLEVITVYKDSPAEKAGLEEEDILLKINGESLDDIGEMMDIISETKVDDKIKITYLRHGKEQESQAIMSNKKKNVFVWKAKHNQREHFVSDEKPAWLGVSTENLTEQLRQYFNVPEHQGVLIKEVHKDSPAEKSGLKAGDIIIQAGKSEIEDSRDLKRAIDRYDAGEEVEVKVIRDKVEQVINVTLEEGKGRFRHHFSFEPERYEIYAPDIEIEIPEMNIEIPEIDLETLRELEEEMREEFEQHSDQLNEELQELNEELKKIKIRTRYRKSIVI